MTCFFCEWNIKQQLKFLLSGIPKTREEMIVPEIYRKTARNDVFIAVEERLKPDREKKFSFHFQRIIIPYFKVPFVGSWLQLKLVWQAFTLGMRPYRPWCATPGPSPWCQLTRLSPCGISSSFSDRFLQRYLLNPFFYYTKKCVYC